MSGSCTCKPFSLCLLRMRTFSSFPYFDIQGSELIYPAKYNLCSDFLTSQDAHCSPCSISNLRSHHIGRVSSQDSWPTMGSPRGRGSLNLEADNWGAGKGPFPSWASQIPGACRPYWSIWWHVPGSLLAAEQAGAPSLFSTCQVSWEGGSFAPHWEWGPAVHLQFPPAQGSTCRVIPFLWPWPLLTAGPQLAAQLLCPACPCPTSSSISGGSPSFAGRSLELKARLTEAAHCWTHGIISKHSFTFCF